MTSIVATNHAVKADSAETRRELAALLSDCGVYAVNDRGRIAVSGGDRVRWLNGMVTNNIRDLQPGHGVYAFLLNPQGHILGDLYVYNRGESLLVETDRSQLEKLLATFDHYIIMDDVELQNLDDRQRSTGISGPRSLRVLSDVGLDVPSLGSLGFADTVWHGAPITIVRGDHHVETYEVSSSPEQAQPLRDALIKAGASPVQSETLELLRIASGNPRYGQDIRERDLPQETEQRRAVHFSKGCYIGQEIVERIRSRGAVHRMFTGFKVQGALPARGTKLQFEGRDVGEITSTASLPLADGEYSVALGYLRRELATPGKAFRTGDTELTVTPVPFADVFSRRS
jgi:aminomethyltransferase